MSNEEDREIVARVLAGDKAAFGALIERHRASALAFSRRILDANEAEDAVREAFLAAFLGLKELRDADGSEPVSWGSSRTCASFAAIPQSCARQTCRRL